MRPARLLVAARAPGAATSPAVDFLVPGLEGLHFCAYGSSAGSVVVACGRQVGAAAHPLPAATPPPAPPPPTPRNAPQLDHIGHAPEDTWAQQQLQTVLVLDLHHPTALAATLSVEPCGDGAAGRQLVPAPLAEPVLHVAFGGGPHLLLAACTHNTLAIVSLEGLAVQLFHQQTSSCAAAEPPALWHQVAAVHCGHADLLALRWAAAAARWA